jgi:hypothetical protein
LLAQNVTNALNCIVHSYPLAIPWKDLEKQLNHVAEQEQLSPDAGNAVHNVQLIGQHLNQAIIPEEE